MKILQDLGKIFEDLAKDLVKILSRSYQDPVKILSRSFRILQDPSRSLARSLKILARSLKILEDPGGSLKILTRIFKDLDEDPHKDPHEDPQRSLKILERFSPGIRTAGVQFMRDNPERFIEIITENSWLRYLNNMCSQGRWADALGRTSCHVKESRGN